MFENFHRTGVATAIVKFFLFRFQLCLVSGHTLLFDQDFLRNQARPIHEYTRFVFSSMLFINFFQELDM